MTCKEKIEFLSRYKEIDDEIDTLQKTRKALRRDKFLCVECNRYGKKTPATVVHHVKERSAYPELEYELTNLESLCEACHNKKHPERGSKIKGRY